MRDKAWIGVDPLFFQKFLISYVVINRKIGLYDNQKTIIYYLTEKNYYDIQYIFYLILQNTL